ncbi:hypothetical protein MJO28_016159 [Puccinia striiformis f. sp. tritici]|uniref:Uncharacterized protein n=1 Tax=Puccinia striiformis f. sp. tritici TaxID=168172 RepID=A0ACC0DSP7_9BASI|nr:hypothetical protein MJO29_015216 [Puccinia striiformis f. sp. tritici]KAI7937260.1 hypothetical protein MJO28_016159 [Puccinia striiformis f. sp. tritici]
MHLAFYSLCFLFPLFLTQVVVQRTRWVPRLATVDENSELSIPGEVPRAPSPSRTTVEGHVSPLKQGPLGSSSNPPAHEIMSMYRQHKAKMLTRSTRFGPQGRFGRLTDIPDADELSTKNPSDKSGFASSREEEVLFIKAGADHQVSTESHSKDPGIFGYHFEDVLDRIIDQYNEGLNKHHNEGIKHSNLVSSLGSKILNDDESRGNFIKNLFLRHSKEFRYSSSQRDDMEAAKEVVYLIRRIFKLRADYLLRYTCRDQNRLKPLFDKLILTRNTMSKIEEISRKILKNNGFLARNFHRINYSPSLDAIERDHNFYCRIQNIVVLSFFNLLEEINDIGKLDQLISFREEIERFRKGVEEIERKAPQLPDPYCTSRDVYNTIYSI